MTTAVVTGGAGGIGAVVADALGDAGMRVATLDVQPLAGPDAADRAHYVCDVRQEASVSAALADLLGEDGTLSVLVNCAGVMQRAAFHEGALQEMLDVIGVNLAGTVVCSRLALPYLTRDPDAAIVNIGSIWATHVWPERSIYSATKAGVEQLSRCMAVDLGPVGVRVHCVSPGLVSTTFTGTVMSDRSFMDAFISRVPAGRAMDAREVAECVVSLARGELPYALGDAVKLHGGYY